jgi:hypothetical protein
MLDTTTGLSAGRGILFAGTGTIAGTTANAQALTINAGTVGTIQVNGAIGSTTTLSSLTVTHSGGARFIGAVSVDTSIVLTNTVSGAVVSFEGGLSTPVLTTTSNPYGISLTGSNNSITTSIEFLNTGSLALGNSSTDAFSFGGNLTVTAPSSLLIAGVFTAGGSITLGDAGTGISLSSGTSISTAAVNADININGAVTGASNTFTVRAGTGTINFGGAVSGLGATTLIANEINVSANYAGTNTLVIAPATTSRGIYLVTPLY